MENNENKTKKKAIAQVGNIILCIIGLTIIISGTILYYLIYTNSSNLQNDQNLSNVNTNTNSNTNTKPNIAENTTVAEIIGDVIENGADTLSTSTQPGSPVSNTTVTTSDATSGNRKVQNENIIVLYDGLILDVNEMKKQDLKYIDSTNTEKDKYVITYYNYENYAFKDSKLGVLSTQVYDGLLRIENVGKVAISESYNAMPRAIQVVNAIPTIISDNNKLDGYDSVKAIINDLDGNGTDEYILVLANKTTGYSQIAFVDSNGANFTELAHIEKSKWGNASEQGYYLSLSNVQVVDVDNDGAMEILVEIPQYEGEPSISILKYKNGELSGEKNIECSLLP